MDCTPEPPGSARRSLLRQVGEGSHLVRLPSFGGTETFLGLSALTSESATSLFQRLYQFAAEHPELRIVRQDVFGVVPDASGHVPKAYRLNGAEWPVTWVSEGNGGGNPVAGIQIHAVDARRVRPVRWGGRVVGTLFQDECAEYCVLAGLRPANARATRAVKRARCWSSWSKSWRKPASRSGM